MIVRNEQNDLKTIRRLSEERLEKKAPAPHKKKLGMEDYMNIMIRQLQFQDPFHPMDNRKFASQLAQFSQLDQLVHLNKKMDGMSDRGKEADSLQMVGFLGREVFLRGNRFHKDPDEAANLVFRLDRPAHHSEIFIYGAKHQLVRTLKSGAMAPGNQHVAWDGLTNRGSMAPKGEYSFEVVARDVKNRPVSASPLRTGIVTGVIFSDKKPLLEVDGEKVALSQVTHVGVVKEGTGPGQRPHEPVLSSPGPVLPVRPPVTAPGIGRYSGAPVRPAPAGRPEKAEARQGPVLHHTL